MVIFKIFSIFFLYSNNKNCTVNNNLKLLQICPLVWNLDYLLLTGKKKESYSASLKPDHNKLKTLNKTCTKSIKGSQHGINTHLSDERMIGDSWLQENKQLYSQYHLFFFEAIVYLIHLKIEIFLSKGNSHTSYLMMATVQINKTETMPLISCAGMTHFFNCSLVTLQWGHITSHIACSRDCLI